LGENTDAYLYGQLATPYLHWDLAKAHFENMDKYNILLNIYHHFQQDMPDVLIDEADQATKLFKAIPLLAQAYQRLPNQNLYVKKK
jgi:hypothetical protein